MSSKEKLHKTELDTSPSPTAHVPTSCNKKSKTNYPHHYPTRRTTPVLPTQENIHPSLLNKTKTSKKKASVATNNIPVNEPDGESISSNDSKSTGIEDEEDSDSSSKEKLNDYELDEFFIKDKDGVEDEIEYRMGEWKKEEIEERRRQRESYLKYKELSKKSQTTAVDETPNFLIKKKPKRNSTQQQDSQSVPPEGESILPSTTSPPSRQEYIHKFYKEAAAAETGFAVTIPKPDIVNIPPNMIEYYDERVPDWKDIPSWQKDVTESYHNKTAEYDRYVQETPGRVREIAWERSQI